MASRFVKNSIFGSISGAIITFGSFLSSLVIARLLGVKETGEIAYALWITNVFYVVTAFGLPFSASRYLPELSDTEDDGAATSLGVALFLRFCVASLLPLGVWLVVALWSLLGLSPHPPSPFDTPAIDVLVAACCLAQAVAEFAKGYLRGLRRFERLARSTMISTVVQLAAVAAGSLLFGVEGALAGYAIGGLCLTTALFDLVGARPFMSDEMRARIKRYSRYRWLAEIFGLFAWSRFEMLFLHSFWGLQQVGIFAVGLTLANAAVQGPLTLTWGMMPHFSDTIARGDLKSVQRIYEKATRTMAFLVFPACFGLAALAAPVIRILYGPAFAASATSSAILIGGSAFAATASIGSNLILATERSDFDLYNGLVGATLSVVGGFTLILPFGSTGAAISRVIVQCAVVAVACVFLARNLKIRIPLASVARFAAAAAVCAACAHAVAQIVPGVAGIGTAILVGMAVYFAGVRVLSGFTPDDAQTFYGLSRLLPSPLSRGFDYLLAVAIK